MSDTSAPISQVQIKDHLFPCDNCGADLRFDPGGDQMLCDHCGSTEPLEGMGHHHHAIRELDLRDALAAKLPQEDIEVTQVSKCPNCAAEVEFDEAVHAAECPFCATPVVTGTGAHRHIKPRGVLPFDLSETAARGAMNDWLGALWFAPSGLQEYASKGRAMQGIYVPYWTFDAETQTRYRGRRGTVYYETRTVVRDGKPTKVKVPKIRWNPASGRVARFFDDVLVLASKSLPKKYTDALEPWDLSALEPYAPEFLAGFRAEGYTVRLETGFDEARARMARQIERDVKFDIGGDRQQITDLDTQVSDMTFKHILLPVWLAAYKYRGTTYRFVVNGRTGRVQGERPYSTGKIALAVFAALLAAAAFGYVYAMNAA